MDPNDVRRVSSAGYRLPQRSNNTRPVTSQPPADRTRYAQADASAEQNQDRCDPVKRDQMWKALVYSERRGVKEWEKNWSFLSNYDQMGQLKSEEPLSSYVSLLSDRGPNTTNQMIGSRLSTPLGREVVRLDRMLLWSRSNQKRKLDPEMLPS